MRAGSRVKKKLLSLSGREAATIIRHGAAVAHAVLERLPSARTTLKVLVLLTGAAAIIAVPTARRGARASTGIIVNTGSDESTLGDGLCSLREAINNANHPFTDTTGGDCAEGSGNDAITVFVLSGQITVGSPLPAIQNTLTIVGPGRTVPINGGANGFTIFSISASATVVMENLTIENTNGAVFNGRGILNSGTLSMINCTIQLSLASINGGAIANEAGTLNVSNSLFENNIANFGSGGAIANESGVVSVSNSTFVLNGAEVNGGAIYNGKNQLLVVSNSTFSDNSASKGGSFYNDNGGVLKVNGTIAAGAAGSECNFAISPVSDLGYNIADDHSCGFGNTNGGGA